MNIGKEQIQAIDSVKDKDQKQKQNNNKQDLKIMNDTEIK